MLGDMLKQMPPEDARAAFQTAFGLWGTGSCKDLDLDDVNQTETILSSGSQQMQSVVEAHLVPFLDARLGPLVNQKLDKKLDMLLDRKLPLLTDRALERNMDTFLYNVEHGQALAEIELREFADNAFIELRHTRDQALEDVGSAVEQRLDDLSDRVHTIVDALDGVEATAVQLKQELRNLLVVQQSHCEDWQRVHPTQLGNTRTRRKSV
jgi:hypothetical protein